MVWMSFNVHVLTYDLEISHRLKVKSQYSPRNPEPALVLSWYKMSVGTAKCRKSGVVDGT